MVVTHAKRQQMKWLRRLAGKEIVPRTPIPPKPYKDNVHNPLKYATDARYYDPKDISITNPDAPHWKDPKFETREKVPFFDFFGYNRDWGKTLFKLGFLIYVFGMIIEGKMFLNYQGGSAGDNHALPLATPSFSKTDKVSETELTAAGFSVVGTKELSVLSNRKP